MAYLGDIIRTLRNEIDTDGSKAPSERFAHGNLNESLGMDMSNPSDLLRMIEHADEKTGDENISADEHERNMIRDFPEYKGKPTDEWLRQAYAILNERLFGGRCVHGLPINLNGRLKASMARTFGRATITIDTFTGRKTKSMHAVGIEISSRYERTERQALEDLAHEMIHVIQFEDEDVDRNPGDKWSRAHVNSPLFCREMDRINNGNDYGLVIDFRENGEVSETEETKKKADSSADRWGDKVILVKFLKGEGNICGMFVDSELRDTFLMKGFIERRCTGAEGYLIEKGSLVPSIGRKKGKIYIGRFIADVESSGAVGKRIFNLEVERKTGRESFVLKTWEGAEIKSSSWYPMIIDGISEAVSDAIEERKRARKMSAKTKAIKENESKMMEEKSNGAMKNGNAADIIDSIVAEVGEENITSVNVNDGKIVVEYEDFVV